MKIITEAGDIKGKRILVRVDWNVPIQDGVVLDKYRIEATLPTLEYLQKAGAKVILATHLEPVDAPMDALRQFLPDGVELIDNLRLDPGEKGNSPEFAKKLASLADIYVNEAFSASHREHASIVGVPKLLPAYAGIRFSLEVQELSKAFYPKRPFLFILGGAKFTTKIPLIEKFVHIADQIFVGGALAHNFFREQEKEIGASLITEGDFDLKKKLASGKIHLPEDMLVRKQGDGVHIVTLGNVQADDVIVDAGPNTMLALKDLISHASSVLWNGPLGAYEQGFREYTLELARALAENGKETILGGADTLAAISELGLFDKFSFVSTGGGAMLDFLAEGTLPGIEALK